MDLSDDVVSQPAPARRKFQPKAKPRPRREASVSVPSTLPSNGKEKATVSSSTVLDDKQSAEPVDVIENSLTNTLEIVSDNKQSQNNGTTEEANTFLGAEHSVDIREYRVPDPVGLSSATSTYIENKEPLTEDICSSVKFSDDGKILGALNPSQTVTPDAQDVGVLGFSGNGSVSNESGDWHSTSGKSVVENADIFSGLEYLDDLLNQPTSGGASEDQVRCNEVAGSYVGGIQIDNTRFDTEEADEDPVFDTSNFESTIALGRRAEKFIPKPRLKTGMEKTNTSSTHPEISIAPPTDLELSFQADDILSYSSLGLDDSIPVDSNTEVRINEEPTNQAETDCPQSSFAQDDIHSEVLPPLPGESGKSGREKASGSEHGKSTRLRRRVSRQLVDEPEDETNVEQGPPDQPTYNSYMDDEEYNDNEGEGGRMPEKRKRSRKSGKRATENEKPSQKQKGSNDEAGVKSSEKRPKKFSHSTRRNKRLVDKTLLETPEDEIDFEKIRFKDLIIFHEHKERLANKEAKSKASLPSQRAENVAREEACPSEDRTLDSEQEEGFDDVKIDSSSFFFNYQSFMKKEPRVKWSKQDTELLIEGVKQFGTNLYMIQLLFPGRSHKQIKSKFTSKNPQLRLQLKEAMESRSKDYSLLKSVAEQLLQAKKEKADEEGGGGGEEEDLNDNASEGVEEATNRETNVEFEKSGHVEEDGNNDKEEADAGEFHSPSKNESADELEMWNEYKYDY